MTVIDLKILGKIIKADNIPEKFKKKEELAMPIRARLLELMAMDNIDPKEVMPDEKPKVCNLKIRMGGSGGITMVTNDVTLDWTQGVALQVGQGHLGQGRPHGERDAPLHQQRLDGRRLPDLEELQGQGQELD